MALLAGSARAEDILHLYNWNNYISDATIARFDSQRELMAAALKHLGYSANDTDAAHWKQARDLIIRAKPYWAAFNASSYIKELTVGNIWLVHGYSSDIFQANLDAQNAGRKFTIASSIPKEGAVQTHDQPGNAARPGSQPASHTVAHVDRDQIEISKEQQPV